jgi:hypothetical protein
MEAASESASLNYDIFIRFRLAKQQASQRIGSLGNRTIVEEVSKWGGINAVVRSNLSNSKLVHNLKPQHDFPFALLGQFTWATTHSMKELQVLIVSPFDDNVCEPLSERY